MYSESKKDDQLTLQETGKEKLSKKAKVALVNTEPSPVEKKPTHHSSKRIFQFLKTKGNRPNYQHRSNRLSN